MSYVIDVPWWNIESYFGRGTGRIYLPQHGDGSLGLDSFHSVSSRPPCDNNVKVTGVHSAIS